MDTLDAIREALVWIAKAKPEEITPETDMVTDLRLDSLGMVELTLVMDEKFGLDQVEPPPGENSVWNGYIFLRHRLKSDGESYEFTVATFAAYVDRLRELPKTRLKRRRRFFRGWG